MAQLRLIALALLASACRASEAGPTSGLVTPAGWQAMPSLESAVTDAAKAGKLAVDGVEAWGDPARGCYSAWLALSGERGAPDVLAAKIVANLTSEPALAGIIVTDVVAPVTGANAGVLSLAFTRPPYRGRLRAQIGGLTGDKTASYAVLACFWNQREPLACETACAQLIGSMK